MSTRPTTGVSFQFDPDKAVAVVTYFASRSNEIRELSKWYMGKLTFLADRDHLVKHGRPIVGDSYKALPEGPVPQHTMDLLHDLIGEAEGHRPRSWDFPEHVGRLKNVVAVDRKFNHPRLRAGAVEGLEALSKSDIASLDITIRLHGKKTYEELSVLTHSMAAYKKVWDSRKSAKAMWMRYEDFFEDAGDAIAGAFEEMIENDALRKAFPRS